MLKNNDIDKLKDKKEDLVDIEIVLNDMYSDSYASIPARDYYYINYATPTERIQMDKEDKIQTIISLAVWVFVIVGIIYAFVVGG